MDIRRIWFESENPNKNINNEWWNENEMWKKYIYK
jgi:hypothetical protein